VGLPLKKLAPHLLESPLLAGLMFPVTALMLIWASRRQPGEQGYGQLSWRQALLIGAFQAFAILPGVSRSGSTIAAGLAVGMHRKSSATFAFLLAIPAIAGAGVLELKDMLAASQPTTSPGLLVIGAAVSFLVGLLSLWWLIRLVERGRLALFAWWLIPLGAAVTIWRVSLLVSD
jgi:undecaprenyl-diphosphatase